MQGKQNQFIVVLVLVILWLVVQSNRIIRVAKKYIGQLELSPGAYEMGFRDKKFEKKMRENGWKEGYDWCAIFVRTVLLEAFTGKKKRLLEKLLTPSTQETYKNLLKAAQKYKWIKVTDKPEKGALAVWQRVENPVFGHIGIITQTKQDKFKTIEGNTPTKYGIDGVTAKWHRLAEQQKYSGLRLHKYFIKIT